jgi:protoporphyrinogen oxidase
MKLAVVGGGYTGLAAARRLLSAGHQVALFERADRTGGLAGCRPYGDTWLETFYHHAFQSDTELIALVRELGMTNDLEWLEGEMGFFVDGQLHPFGTPLSLLSFKPLTPTDRLRFGLSILRLSKLKHFEALDDLSVKAWFQRHVGGQVYEKCWEPLLRGKFGADADDISMAWLWGKIHLRGGNRRGSRERLGYVRGSFGIVEHRLRDHLLASGLTLHVGTEVKAIRPCHEGGVTLSVGHESFQFDQALITTPMPAVPRLLPDLPRDFADHCAAIEHIGVLCGTLSLKQPFSRFYWLNIGDPGFPFGGLIEHTNMVRDAGYRGNHILYVSNYINMKEPAFSYTDSQLLQRWVEGLARVRPGFSMADISDFHIARASHAQPVIRVGYRHRRPAFETPLSGVYIANMTHIYPEDRGMNYALRCGADAADAMLSASSRRTEGSHLDQLR